MGEGDVRNQKPEASLVNIMFFTIHIRNNGKIKLIGGAEFVLSVA